MTDEPVTAGIDIGSSSAQAVVMRGNALLSYCNERAGVDRKATARRVLDLALEDGGISNPDVACIVGTGYGRLQIPFADKTITEITCHALGAHYFFPQAGTILDMGGQDCKAIHCDSSGNVIDFLMNDKCAAGTGRAMEVIAKLFNLPLIAIGALSLDISGEPPTLSSNCVVFAKSEALQMVRRGVGINEVLAAYTAALAQRIAVLIQRIGLRKQLVISGGIAKNIGVVSRLESILNITALIAPEPQIIGAVGAALAAARLANNTIARRR